MVASLPNYEDSTSASVQAPSPRVEGEGHRMTRAFFTLESLRGWGQASPLSNCQSPTLPRNPHAEDS